MSRWLSTLLLVCFTAFADDRKKEEPPPPDEDAAATAKQYAFNPLQAQKELSVGNQYFKKGSYGAAVQRYREATKWNPGFAEAWLRLGEAAERRNDRKTAAQAYAKYLELQPDARNAPEIKKKLEKLKH